MFRLFFRNCQHQPRLRECRFTGCAIITWIAFSWRLRYLVFSDILSGTWSKLFLVQMTLLAWLEQEQRVGHGGAAPVSWGPWWGNHNRSWTNQRRGEGGKGLVTMTRRMATESWPTPIAKMLLSHLHKNGGFNCFSWCPYCKLVNSCTLLRKKNDNFAGEIYRRLAGSFSFFAHGSMAVPGLALFKCRAKLYFPFQCHVVRSKWGTGFSWRSLVDNCRGRGLVGGGEKAERRGRSSKCSSFRIRESVTQLQSLIPWSLLSPEQMTSCWELSPLKRQLVNTALYQKVSVSCHFLCAKRQDYDLKMATKRE